MNSPLSTEMYTLLAMAARYFFAGLMALIVFRAWRITIRDNRRAKLLRDLSPETGCVGELIFSPGTRTRQTIPIPREGVLGSGPKADIHIRSKDVLPAHAHVEERQGGLLIRPMGRAEIALGKGGFTGDQLFARDGDILVIGKHQFLIVLFQPDGSAQDAEIETPPEPLASTPMPSPTKTAGRPQQTPPPAPTLPVDPPKSVPPTKPARKTAPKATAQPEAESAPQTAPTAKATSKTTATASTKPAAPVAAKPMAKTSAAKPATKPATKPTTTPTIKPATKPSTKPKPNLKPPANPFAAEKPSAKPKAKRGVDPFTFFDGTDDDFFDEDKLWNEHRK